VRGVIHRLIVKYLLRCGGAFHSGPYGEQGKYVRLFTDKEYDEYQKFLCEKGL